MTEVQGKRLGERLVEAGLITPDQLNLALAHQSVAECTIGSALVDLEMVSVADVLNAVVEQRRDMLNTGRLGDLAVESGKVSRSAVGRAVALQRSRRLPLGQVMLDEGMLSESDLYDLLDRQLQLRGAVASS